MKRTRLFQITVLLLVVVSAVTVGYWLFDQHQRGAEKTAALVRLYDQQSAAARALLTAGVPVERIQGLFPDLAVSADQVGLAPERQAALVGGAPGETRRDLALWAGRRATSRHRFRPRTTARRSTTTGSRGPGDRLAWAPE